VPIFNLAGGVGPSIYFSICVIHSSTTLCVAVQVEERLCEQERRLRSEVETRHEADVQELSDRIAALTRVRSDQNL
jgi:hypothetical protein